MTAIQLGMYQLKPNPLERLAKRLETNLSTNNNNVVVRRKLDSQAKMPLIFEILMAYNWYVGKPIS